MNSAQSTWGEVSVLGAKCGQLIHRRNSIVIVVYTVEACITVPESCKGGKTMRTFLHCSKLSASDSNAHARCSFALCHLSLWAEMERRCLAGLSCVTQTPSRSSIRAWRYLVDPASSHMLVSKIKPCMSKYECLYTVKLRMAH